MRELDKGTSDSRGGPADGLLTVLIVDDDAVAREIARRVAGAMPAVAIEGEADSGEGALEWLARRMADVVLMDWSMPGIDGVETTTRVLDRHPGIRVVGWTSNADRVLHSRFRDAGAADVLVKSDLVGLRRFLRRVATQRGDAP